MKRIYVNSRLEPLVILSDTLPEHEWLWSQGDRWLRLTASRMSYLIGKLGEDDKRIKALLKALADDASDEADLWPLDHDEVHAELALVEEDRRLDRERRAWIAEEHPDDLCDGVLWPNWRINRNRRLERDWDDAVNRVLLGQGYRKVAKEFNCSTGLLHKKVHEALDITGARMPRKRGC